MQDLQPHRIMSTIYTISDLAKEFDLTTRAIRFYEDMGLLQPERSGAGGRNRVYSSRDRARLRLTLRAKRLGLSLSEAKEIIGKLQFEIKELNAEADILRAEKKALDTDFASRLAEPQPAAGTWTRRWRRFLGRS